MEKDERYLVTHKIMIVDDEDLVRNALARSLKTVILAINKGNVSRFPTKPFEDNSQISECVEKAFSRKKLIETKMARKKRLMEKFY